MNFIKQSALSLGFDACGIAKAEALSDDALFFRAWLDQGKHGEMHYLERNFQKRTDPRELVSGCQSVVVVLMNYFPLNFQPETAPKIAKYAYPTLDYHWVMKTKLVQLEQKLVEHYGSDCVNGKLQHSFVDSAPVLERRWAERAGLGWIGKNMQLIHPEFGSFCFIGVLMLNIETDYDVPMKSRCGSCSLCLEACPTKALDGVGLDARRCISYLTIESKTEIPEAFQTQLSNYVYGCDICGDVCPWNRKKTKPSQHSEFSVQPTILSFDSEKWFQLTEEQFRQSFQHSAIQRAGYQKFKSNLNALQNNRV